MSTVASAGRSSRRRAIAIESRRSWELRSWSPTNAQARARPLSTITRRSESRSASTVDASVRSSSAPASTAAMRQHEFSNPTAARANSSPSPMSRAMSAAARYATSASVPCPPR